MTLVDPTGRRYSRTPEAQPPAPPAVDDVFWARITGNSSLGSGRWSYTFAEAEKSAGAYGGFTALDGGRTGTCYNAMEDVADKASSALADNTPVLVREVLLAGQSAPEYWIVATLPGIVLASAPSDEQIPQYDGGTETWVPQDPAVVSALGEGWEGLKPHFAKFNSNVATQDVTIAEVDLRDKLVRETMWYYYTNSADLTVTTSFGWPVVLEHVYYIDDTLSADVTMDVKASVALKVDKDSGYPKWSYTNHNGFWYWVLCFIWHRPFTPDVTIES